MISDDFSKRNMISNVLLVAFLSIPVLLDFIGIVFSPILVLGAKTYTDILHVIAIEANCIIALLAVYGLVFNNKRIALYLGLTTFYALIIITLAALSDVCVPLYERNEFTRSDLRAEFGYTLFLGAIICLIMWLFLMAALLIRKNGKSAFALLERGGVFTNAKVEIAVVAISNITLIITTYFVKLAEIQ